MNEEKLTSRRQKIFAALDQMKEANERISAQKLAAEVRMGKQTVLPVYREWLEAEALTDAQQVELSESLLHAIKKEIAREKFRLGEEAREFSENLQDKEDLILQKEEELQALQQGWSKEKSNYLATITEQEQQIDSKESELKELHNALHAIEKKQEASLATIEGLNNQLKAADKEKENALKELENNLDKAHQQLLDHWIKTTDTERKEKEKFQQALEQNQKKETELHKKIVSSEYEASHLRTEIKQISIALADCEKENNDLHELAEIAKKAINLLGSTEDMETRITFMIETEREYKQQSYQINILQSQLGEAQEKIAENAALEKEVVKLQAYIDGLTHSHTGK